MYMCVCRYVYICAHMYAFVPKFEIRCQPISIALCVFFCFHLQLTCFAQFCMKTHKQEKNIHTILGVTLCQNPSVSRHIY